MTLWEHALQYLPFKDVSSDEVYQRLIDGGAVLWSGPECAAVTEITDEGLLHIWLAGGKIQQLITMLTGAEAAAREMECKGVELSGRKGWQRLFKRYGYAFDGDRMVKFFDEQ